MTNFCQKGLKCRLTRAKNVPHLHSFRTFASSDETQCKCLEGKAIVPDKLMRPLPVEARSFVKMQLAPRWKLKDYLATGKNYSHPVKG